MATYLQDGVGVFPQEQGFTPNYNFIMRALEMRQNQYDQGFAQFKSVQNSVLSAELLREDNKEKRDLILANAEKALKDLPMVDLSNPKNVTAAKSVFKPFFEDDDILWDMAQTKEVKSQIARGQALQNSSKEEERKRYWGVGVQDLYDWIDEFKEASKTDARGMRSRRYVGKPQVADEIFTLFKEGKLKVSIDKLSCMQKITYENGQESIIPITNLYISKVQNDPEALEGFNVYGRVQRNRFIKDNVASGNYKTKEEAAAAHDKSLVNDYIALQTKGITQSTEALGIVNDKVKSLQKKLADGTMTEAEAQDLARAENEQASLQAKIKEYEINKQNAPALIERDPAGYLGRVYMHKSANDLAVALSTVNMSKKIESNPIYKDFIFSKEFEIFKTDQQIRLEKEKSALNMREEEWKAQLKSIYGDGDGDGGDGSSGGKGGKGTSKSQLNIPEVKESPAASGVEKRYNGLPDAYGQFIDNKRNVISQLAESKASLIFDALSPNEIVDDKGNPLNQNQMRALLGNGALLDKLYAKAVTKITNYASSDPEKFKRLNSTQLKVSNLNNVWAAMDKQGESWLKEIIGNLEATETHPDKVVERQEAVGRGGVSGGGEYRTVKEVIPGKNEGWIYKYLLNSKGQLLADGDPNEFLKGISKDKNFQDRVGKRFAENVSSYYAGLATNNPLNLFKSKPTYEQARTEVYNEFKDKYKDYRDKVLNNWNTRGLNFLTQYAPIPGGGGTTSRVLTFTGSNKVSGETADVLVTDLLTKLPGIAGGSQDVFVTYGPDKPGTDSGDGDSDLKKLFINGALGRELMNAIKLGKDSELKGYSITTSMVGGNDPKYHAYTINFDIGFIDKIASMKDANDQPLFTDASKLRDGLTVYVKKDIDKTIAATKSTMGEIDILVNTNPQGTLEKEVIPGYGLTITKNPISGGYKITTNYPKITAENLNGVPVEREVIVPEGSDLTTAYYETINNLLTLYTQTQTAKDNFVKSQPKKITREDVDRMKTEGGY